jgi:hypothetical protein
MFSNLLFQVAKPAVPDPEVAYRSFRQSPDIPDHTNKKTPDF